MLDHWHFDENVPEIESIVFLLWKLPRVYGTITDRNGACLSEVEITARRISCSEELSTISDKDGYYSLAGHASGKYSIAARRDDFVSQTKISRLGAHTAERIDFVLLSLEPAGSEKDIHQCLARRYNKTG